MCLFWGIQLDLIMGPANQTPVRSALTILRLRIGFGFIKTQKLRAEKRPCHLVYQPLYRDEQTEVPEGKALLLYPLLINATLRPYAQTRSTESTAISILLAPRLCPQ